METCNTCNLNKIRGRFAPCGPQLPANLDLPILWVGQAPGGTEMITGVPFTGGAGKQLFSLMRMAGVDKRKQLIVNPVMCQPLGDRPPLPSELKACLPNLMASMTKANTIATLNSLEGEGVKLVVVMGDTAASWLTGRSGILRLRGSFGSLREPFAALFPKARVLYLLHPAYVMRQRQWIPVMVKDIQRGVEFAETGRYPFTNELHFLHDPRLEELKTYLEGHGLDPEDPVAFDTETTGLNFFEDKLIGISFAVDGESACACQLSQIDPRIPYIKDWLQDPKVFKCAQNGMFDITMIRENWGIEVQGLTFDTRVAEMALRSDLPTNLDFLRSMYTPIPPYKPTKAEMKNIAHWTHEVLIEYACKDAVVTYQVMKGQQKDLDEGTSRVLKDILVPVTPVLSRMTSKGMKVTKENLAIAYWTIQPKIEAVESKFKNELNLNVRSPLALQKFFGIPSTDKEDVKGQILRGHKHKEYLEDLLEHRGQTALAKLILGLSKSLVWHGDHHRVHTQYNTDGTRTGRLSSTNPNLQNITKDFRYLFEADPGHVLLLGDYRQMQLNIAACLSGCKKMQEDLKAGLDIHTIVKDLILPYIEGIGSATSKGQHAFRGTPLAGGLQPRVIAKAVVFGTLFGATARRFARSFNVPVEVAQTWQDVLLKHYEELGTFIKEKHKEVRETGIVTTPFGRRRFVENYESTTDNTALNKAINTPIQATEADVVLETMILLDKEGYDLRLTTHDEIVVQLPADDWERHAKKINAIYTRPIPQLNGYTFPADFEVGPSWGNHEGVNF